MGGEVCYCLAASSNWTSDVHSVENSRKFHIPGLAGTWEPYGGERFWDRIFLVHGSCISEE